MTNQLQQLRYVLWLVLFGLLWMNYSAWTAHFAVPRSPAASPASASGLASSVPQAPAQAPAQTSTQASAPVSAPPAPTPSAPRPAATKALAKLASVPRAAPVIHVRTDVYDLEISTEGATLVKVDLLRYAKVEGKAARVQLESTRPASEYLLQTGLTGSPSSDYPTQTARFSAAKTDYRMGRTGILRVPLTWRKGGVTVTKTFVFHKGSYRIGLKYRIENRSRAPWNFLAYAQLFRNDPRTKSSYLHPTSDAYHGPAIWNGHKYVELNPASSDYKHFAQDVTDGWIAVPQHDFVTAVVFPKGERYRFTSRVSGPTYLIAATGPERTLGPNATLTLNQTLFVGPTLHGQLEKTDPTLAYLENYGFFTILARPLFWLLSQADRVTGNWGVAIIVVTILLKLLFYPLSEASGRSMAKMKALGPRIKNIQETYKNDKEKLGRAMMELYKREKVNPVSGCLPTLLQFPVFIAFYWVLLYSAELRQAPFIFWIHNLSARDPYYILPAIMAATGIMQFKLNAPPADPMQAKMMMFMPLVMAGLFAFFPSGLVLYYVVNSLLSIAQQWHINRRIAGATSRRT